MAGTIEIKLGNEVRGLRFGNYALMTYNSLTNTDALSVKELDETYQYIDFVRDIVFCGLKGWYKVNGKLCDFTINDVTEWVDTMDFNNIKVIVDEWSASIQSSELIKQSIEALNVSDSEVKKK
jgi:hypothetical protein